MSVETLRRASALMRERAEGATEDVCPDWTQSAVRHIARNCDIECAHFEDDPLLVTVPHDDGTSLNTWGRYNDAAHIASWHPAVALAVADWLEDTADAIDAHLARQADPEIRFHGTWTAVAESTHAHALTVARTYLGEQP